MSTTTRTLTPADLKLFKDLMIVFAIAFDDDASYQRNVPDDDYLTRLLGREHFITVVALHEERVIGGLTAYQLDKFEQVRREFYVYDLAVLGQFRRQGVARSLFAELKRVATERGAYVIFVQADLVDGPAIALYEKLGTRESVLHFDIAVPPRPVQST